MNGKSATPSPFKPAGIYAELPIIVRQIRAIAHEAAREHVFAKVVNGWYAVTGREGHELLAAADEERIATYKQRPRTLLNECRKG